MYLLLIFWYILIAYVLLYTYCACFKIYLLQMFYNLHIAHVLVFTYCLCFSSYFISHILVHFITYLLHMF